MNGIIVDFLNDPYTFVESHDDKTLVKLAKFADKSYYNSENPIMSDQEYDMLRDSIKLKYPNHPYNLESGHSVKVDKVKVTLPYCLGSAFKPNAKDVEKFIEKFKKKFPGPYMISEKLDGVSGLFRNGNDKQLLTKGDSLVGTDITNLVPSLFPSEYEKGIDVRGEIIMKDNVFQKNHSLEKENARNAVAGLVNSKTVNKQVLKDSDFVAYELVKPWTSYDQQFTILKNMGFSVVKHELVDDFDLNMLKRLYSSYTGNSLYECDGIIVSQNNVSKRAQVKYPPYMFAFKNMDDLETKIVTVKEIKWQISKDGYIKPVVTFDPVRLAGVNVKRVTSHNAKYIYDNSLGPGAKIELVRSGGVIPYIKRIVKQAKEPQMPEIDYEWNITEVDIITTKYSHDQKAKELAKFFSVMKIDGMALNNTLKIIDANIDTIPKIFNVTKRQLLSVENFKDKMATKIYNAIQECANKCDLPTLMVASNIFGHGIGMRLMKRVFTSYPDIIFKYIELSKTDFYELLNGIEDFAEQRSEQFQLAMNNFLQMFNALPNGIQERLMFEPYQPITVTDESEDERFLNKKFIFSDFRNPEWEKIIILKGGSIVTSVSKNTYMLITTQKAIDENKNSKLLKAQKFNCKILSSEDFKNQYLN